MKPKDEIVRHPPTVRYTVRSYHPNGGDKPLVMITYDLATVEEHRASLAAKGFTRVDVETEQLAQSSPS